MKILIAPFKFLFFILMFIIGGIIGIITMLIPTNWLVQRSMMKEAHRLAKEVVKLYPESKSRNPNAPETEVIKNMAFDEEVLANMSESSRTRIEACCETINGFCYMMALDIGKFKGWMNLRSLQFTYYMDKALEAEGFPPQSKEQKERILETMELRIRNWERYTGD